MQSKKHSFIEACVNILIGYGVAVVSQLLIFPLFGVNLPLGDNLMIGAWFTVISLIRSYVIRRGFNWWHACEARADVPEPFHPDIYKAEPSIDRYRIVAPDGAAEPIIDYRP